MDKINNLFSNLQVLNMLNMKYVIYNPDGMPLINNSAYGNAWFVDDVVMVSNPDQEIDEVGKNDLKKTAIIDNKFASQLEGVNYGSTFNSAISLRSYVPNKLVYDFESEKEQLVVFSEIYYDKGWNAYLDGEEYPYMRANYVLRAMVVPEGKHIIEFKFEPRIWVIGERISFISSLLLIILLLAGLALEIRSSIKSNKTDIKNV